MFQSELIIEFEEKLKFARDIDDLCAAHEEILQRMRDRCLLNANSSFVMGTIRKILGLCILLKSKCEAVARGNSSNFLLRSDAANENEQEAESKEDREDRMRSDAFRGESRPIGVARKWWDTIDVEKIESEFKDSTQVLLIIIRKALQQRTFPHCK